MTQDAADVTPETLEAAQRAARLAAAKAAKAEFDRRREARDAARAAEAEVAKAEREVVEAAAIEAAECEHGPVGEKIAIVETIYGIVIVKRPHPVTYRKFQDEGKANVAAFTKFVDQCRVYPDQDALDKLLDAQPGKLVDCANAAAALAGMHAAEQSKK
jgi:hypothetical protein